MCRKTIAIAVIALGLAAPAATPYAWADEAPPPDTAGGRYVFARQAGGYIRLDTETGAVSLCSQRAVGWACEAAPDDRALLENEIARLRAENAALKKDLIARGLPLPPGALAEAPPEKNNQVTVQLPSDAELDRIAAFVGRVWHRFVDAIERAQRQIFNKS